MEKKLIKFMKTTNSVPILKLVKKILNPVIKFITAIFIWMILLINFYLFPSSKNHIPFLLMKICFNGSLEFKINPRLIKYHVSDPDSTPGKNIFVWSGEWDKDVISIEEHEKFIMIKELLVDKKDYRDIKFYSFAIKRMHQGNPLGRGGVKLDSIENIIQYFKKHKKIFNNIKTNGFNLNIASRIGVAISRDGHFIHFRQGHHTLAMAKILGIENVVIRIRAVHRLWLLDQVKHSELSLLSSFRGGFKELYLKSNQN